MSDEQQYDDSAKGGYSYAEKLKAVSDGMMDPAELGMKSPEEAGIHLAPEDKPKAEFGTTLMFRAGAVPPELRAHWAISEEKIVVPESEKAEWTAKWIEDHKNEFPVQAELLCGTAKAQFAQTFRDPIIGLAQMLRQAADLLEAKYIEQNEAPIVNADAPTPNEPEVS